MKNRGGKYKIKILNILVFLFFLTIITKVEAKHEIISIKLPYEKGETFTITRGYGINETHLGKDVYALDFTEGGCKSFDKNILAISKGVVIKTSDEHKNGEKNSYGNQIIINHDKGFSSRYAHLNKIYVKEGDEVKQGQIIGTMGNTGSVWGTACKEHPGTHLHFVLYKDNEPFKPEPMSNYTDFRVGEWYTSDNEPYDPNAPELKPTIEPISQPQQTTEPTTSWWQKLINWFWNLFQQNQQQIAGQQEQATIPENSDQNSEPITEKPVLIQEIYNSQYISQSSYPTLSPNQTTQLTVSFKNTGNTVWTKQNVSLNIVDSRGYSDFYHSSWLTHKRPTTLDQDQINPGESGSFSFTIQAPTQPGVYRFYIRPVYQDQTGFHWLGPDFGVYWLINVATTIPQIEHIDQLETEKNDQETLPAENQVTEPANDFQAKQPQDSDNSGGGNSNGSGGGSSSPSPEINVLSAPTITSPTTSSIFITNNTSTIIISGTKTEDSTLIFFWHNNLLTEITNFSSPTDWQTEIELSEGANEIRVSAANNSGDISTESELNIIYDTIEPEITDWQAGKINSSSVQLFFTPSETNLNCQIRFADFNLAADNWNQASSSEYLISTNSTSSQSVILENIDNLNQQKFYLKCQDQANNWSDIYGPIKITELPDINNISGFEITGHSILLQWLMPIFEIKNIETAKFEVRLSNSEITDDNLTAAEILEINEQPTINMVEQLFVDNLQPSTDYYFAIKYYDGLNWSKTFYSTAIATTDGSYSQINGSLNNAFMANHLLTSANSPYVVSSMAMVYRDKILTIEPGTIIKFQAGASLFAMGPIQAQGTAENPIIFTSIKDDEYGGDINNDLNAINPTAGDWSGITIRNSATDPTVFDYVVIQYGSHIMLQLAVLDQATISNSIIQKSTGIGLKILSINNLDIHHNLITENKIGLHYNNSEQADIGYNNIVNNQVASDPILESGGMIITNSSATTNIHDNNFHNNNFWGVFAYNNEDMTATNNYFGSESGPIAMTMEEFIADPHQYDSRGQKDIVHGTWDWSDFSPAEIAW